MYNIAHKNQENFWSFKSFLYFCSLKRIDLLSIKNGYKRTHY